MFDFEVISVSIGGDGACLRHAVPCTPFSVFV